MTFRRGLVSLCLLVLLSGTPGDAASLPEIRFEAPDSMRSLVERLERTDTRPLRRALALTGLTEPGPPITVVLAEEGSPEALRAPSWAAGYAFGAAGYVVLLPARSPGYPDHDLISTYHHEITHVFVARAAGRQPVPRWLNEGIAMYAADRWGIDDQTQLILATIRREHFSVDSLSSSFPAGQIQARRAYALSGAFVRDLVARHGEDAIAAILSGIADGLTPETAFARATGERIAIAEAQFWRGNRFWNRWLPLIGSSTTLWLAVTALALWAFIRRRQRDDIQRARWALEEEGTWVEPPPGGWVN
ncbi:MAG: peptidase MA family metallohydrolase [Acidobacteriota bacterium]